MKYKNVLFLVIYNNAKTYNYINVLSLYYFVFNFTKKVINESIEISAEELVKNESIISKIDCRNLKDLIHLYTDNSEDLKKQNYVKNIAKNALEKILKIYKNNSSIEIFSKTLNQIINVNGSITIGVETNYVDRIYRDTYYNFFSNLHEDFSRKCKRLVFFKGTESFKDLISFIYSKANSKNEFEKNLNENFIGSMVIRPLKTGAIGRTLFNPKKFLTKNSEYYIRTSQWKVSFLGLELSVKAFPFLMQDGITTSCAETVLLALMDYYSQQYNDYKFALPSAINDINMKENGKRAIPTNGLSYETMSKILCEFGFYTTFDCNFANNDLRRFLYYYIESGIPIIINMQREDKVNSLDSVTGHAALCIGHGEKEINDLLSNIEYENCLYYANTALAYNKIYVMDDNLRPYSCYTYNNLNSCFPSNILDQNKLNYFMTRDDNKKLNIDCYIVPLHKHMYMDAKRAEDIVRELLSSETSASNDIKQYNPVTYYNCKSEWGTRQNPIIYRLFLASSRHLKHHRMMHNDNNVLIDLYTETPMPQFVWVCEFYTKESYDCDYPYAIGEIIIDATRCAKSSLFSSILMINYSGSVHYVRSLTNTINLSKSKQSNIKQDDIDLKKVKDNYFKIAPYNLNLHDKNFF